MRGMIVALALALASSTALAAAPQRVPMNMGAMTPMTEAALASHVGDWIYDADGSIVGSLERLRGTREAVVHVSTFFMGGNKLVVMPIEKLGVVDGRSLCTTRLLRHWRPCRHCLSRRPVSAALPLNMREALPACSAAKSSL